MGGQHYPERFCAVTDIASYTWNPRCCLPYESEIARISKFCYLNAISWEIARLNSDVRTMIRQRANETLEIRIPKSLAIPNTRTRICPCCIRFGYHSRFHQIKGVNRCFLHGTILENGIIDYEHNEELHGTTSDSFGGIVERLINNDTLLQEIREFEKNMQKKQPYIFDLICPDYFEWFNPIWHKSSTDLYRRVMFGQQTSTGLCRLVYSISNHLIDETNNVIAQNLISAYTINGSDRPLHVTNPTKFYTRCDNVPSELTGSTTGWCLNHIITRTTLESFNGQLFLYNRYLWNAVLSKKSILSYRQKAVTITNMLITRHYSEEIVGHKYWSRVGEKPYPSYLNCDGLFNSSPERYSRRYYPHALQFILYPLLEDLYNSVCEKVMQLLIQNLLPETTKQLEDVAHLIGKLPQYAIVIYPNRTELFACEPEKGDKTEQRSDSGQDC